MNLDITGLDLARDNNLPVELRKKESGWYMGDWPADAAAIQETRDIIRSARLVRKISDRRETYSGFEVTRAKGMIVNIISSNNEDIIVFIGRNSAGNDMNFVRIGGNPAVYLADGMNRERLIKDRDSWKDKSVIRTEWDSIEAISIKTPVEMFSVSRGTTNWAGAVDRLKGLKASGFIEKVEENADIFTVPYVEIKLHKAEGSAEKYIIFKKDAVYLAKPSELNIVYEVEPARVETIKDLVGREKVHERYKR
ncbi:MAG: DUF4340 domain-containing protein [Elusimicrobiota bacterium]